MRPVMRRDATNSPEIVRSSADAGLSDEDCVARCDCASVPEALVFRVGIAGETRCGAARRRIGRESLGCGANRSTTASVAWKTSHMVEMVCRGATFVQHERCRWFPCRASIPWGTACTPGHHAYEPSSPIHTGPGRLSKHMHLENFHTHGRRRTCTPVVVMQAYNYRTSFLGRVQTQTRAPVQRRTSMIGWVNMFLLATWPELDRAQISG